MQKSFPYDIGTVHIIGIGGIGMSGYAEVLHQLGYKVQGSDMGENANVLRLREMGVKVDIGHKAENIRDAKGDLCTVVVRSTAVKDNNVEVMEAMNEGIPVIPRVELLAEIMRSKWCINISGTHGKTTTTSILGNLLDCNGQDPTIMNGGIISTYGSNAKLGNSDWMVVEADESDGTFAKLPAVAAIITNIDPEHLDYYKTFENAKKAFVSYVHNLPFYGFAVACIDHPVVRELIQQFTRQTFTYGISDDADIKASNIKPQPDGISFDVEFSENLPRFPKKIEGLKIPLFGRHNVLNTLTTFAVGHELGFELENIIASFAKIPTVKRRFTRVGSYNDILAIDDYAHHPSEIAAVIKAARDFVTSRGGGKIITVFQPHRYSRAADLYDGFCRCFVGVDAVAVMDVYAAGEDKIEGVTKERFAAGIREHSWVDNVYTIGDKAEIPELVNKIASPGDVVVFMGAGDITKSAYALPQALEEIATGKKAVG